MYLVPPSRRERTPPAALFGLILATLLVAVLPVPAADAQIYVLARPDDFTYGWTFPDNDGPGVSAPDAAGDNEISAADTPLIPAGALPVMKTGDLIGVRFDEPDDTVLRLRIDLAGMDPATDGRTLWLDRADYRFSFSLAGSDYTLLAYLVPTCGDPEPLCEPLTEPALGAFASLRQQQVDDSEMLGYLPARAVVEDSALEVLIPRQVLDRSGPGAHPLAGDALHLTSAEAQSGFCILAGVETCFHVTDTLDGLPFQPFHVLEVDSAGSMIQVGSAVKETIEEDEDGPEEDFASAGPITPRRVRLDVDLSEPATLPLQVTNHMTMKALLAPQATVLSDHAVALTVPTSLQVPNGAARPLHITLEAPDGTATAPILLEVRIESLGTATPFADHLLIEIHDTPRLTPQQNRLYLHAASQDGLGLDNDAVSLFSWSTGWLNTLETDEADDGSGSRLHDLCLCGDAVWAWRHDAVLTAPLYLENETAGTFHLAYTNPMEGELDVQATLVYDDTAVAAASKSLSLAEGDGTVDLPLRILDEDAQLEPGASLTLYLDATFRIGGVPLSELANIYPVAAPMLKTGGATWLDLPIAETPAVYRDARHLVVALGHDQVQYVNPGRAALWNVTIVNQADENDTVQVGADTEAAGWNLKVQPGTRYQIGPGESVTVGVRARAPEDAAEATSAAINISIVSALADGGANAVLTSAVVTHGAEIGEAAFEADPETLKRQKDDTKVRDSPVGMLLPLVAALGAAAWCRRRPDA